MSFLRRAATVPVLPANFVGAVVVFVYFNYIDELGPGPRSRLPAFLVFTAVTVVLIGANAWLGARWLRPLAMWRARIDAGLDPTRVPLVIRRRVLNASLTGAVLTMLGWMLAGLFYFPYISWVLGSGPLEGWRGFVGIVFVAGPMTAALAFLVGEFHWRREIPVFFPDGKLERSGVLRVPVLVRLGVTFLVTSMLPPVLMLITDLSLSVRFGGSLPDGVRPIWRALMQAQGYIVVATGLGSILMAWLVARFINRPLQALRAAMARVAAGDLDVLVPVRSNDELGEVNMHFNAMVGELRQAERMREVFGRYVSPAVARQALERGIALGGEVVHATAMFADLRGFTALTRRLPAARVVEVLNEYYALVDRVCEPTGGVMTQFHGDGVVVVFGGPLVPVADHARRAVEAAIALQRSLAARPAEAVGGRLEAGVGICTGEMIAGNVGAGGRVTYTIVGDAVNQAARLQVKTRELGASILLTESTRAALGPDPRIALRPCGPVPLKGIEAPVEVYAVMLDV